MEINDNFKGLFDLDQFTEFVEPSDNESSACQQGDICESQFVLDAKLHGFEVFLPVGHATKVDIAIRKPGFDLVSIQIKKGVFNKRRGNHTAYWKWICGSGKPSSAVNPNDYGLRYTRYKKGDFHVLCGYIMEHGSWVFHNLEDVCEKSSVTWRPNQGLNQDNWEIFDPYFTYDRITD